MSVKDVFVGLQILDPGEQDIGFAMDVKVLHAIEDAITDRAQQSGLVYVGRIRNNGDWQLSFYDDAAIETALIYF